MQAARARGDFTERCFHSSSTISPSQNEATHLQTLPWVLPSSGMKGCAGASPVPRGGPSSPFLPIAPLPGHKRLQTSSEKCPAAPCMAATNYPWNLWAPGMQEDGYLTAASDHLPFIPQRWQLTSVELTPSYTHPTAGWTPLICTKAQQEKRKDPNLPTPDGSHSAFPIHRDPKPCPASCQPPPH